MMRLFLDVPYSEKDEAKSLGAKWNAIVKKWYVEVKPEEYVKFAKWIMKDTDDAIIATEYIHIIETERECWKCKQLTRVIGLGIGEYVHIYGEIDDPQYEYIQDYMEVGEEVRLAWVDKEEDVPPKLLNYIKEKYSVKTGYSKTIGGKCFANHCDCCGAMQGNWFLFNEPDSPLSSCVDGVELINRMKKIKVKGIPIDDNLQLNWSIGFCSNDYAYLKYGQYEELVLSNNPENEYISYEELYILSKGKAV
ncbi:MAG: hypothetical protein IJC02_03650 [Lachnospiraceae bacterium]|nr:hypothetical protein [Lachnospiraceae bacterium]